MGVLVATRLRDEDDLVNPSARVAFDQLRDLLRGANGAAQRAHLLLQQPHRERRVARANQLAGETALDAIALELLPDVGPTRLMLAKDVVMRQRKPEEVRPVDTPIDRRLLIRVAHERDHHGHVRIDRQTGWHALVGLNDRVVLVDPRSGLLGFDKRKRQRTQAVARGGQDGVTATAGDPERRVRLLFRLRHQVARGHGQKSTLVASERLLRQQPRRDLERLLPLGSLRLALDAESAELGLRAGLTGAELHAPTRDQVERGNAFRYPGRMVVVRRQLDDPVAQADAPGALAGGREEHFGRRAMAVFFEKVVLHFPHAVEAEPVRELDLLKGIVEQLFLIARSVWPRQLMLVEQTESHVALPVSSGRAKNLTRNNTVGRRGMAAYSGKHYQGS